MNASKWVLTVLACGVALAGLGFYKLAEIRAGIAAAEAFPEQSETVEVATVAFADYRPELDDRRRGRRAAAPRPAQRDRRRDRGRELRVRAQQSAEGAGAHSARRFASSEPNLKAAQARADLAQAGARSEPAAVRIAVFRTPIRWIGANAELTTASAQIDVLNRTIAKMTLRAPFDGRAGLHTFEVGQFLLEQYADHEPGRQHRRHVGRFSGAAVLSAASVPAPKLGVTTIDDANDTTRIAAIVIAENTVLNATQSQPRLSRESARSRSAVRRPTRW